MRRLVLAACAVAVLAGCQPAAPPDDAASQAPTSPQAAVAAVRQIIQQEIDDWNAGDIDAVLAIFADDVVRMLPDTVTVGKAALPDRWRQHLEENTDVWEPTIDEIEAAGDLVFVKLHFTETTTPKAGGESTVFHGEGVTVFRRSASGRWEVVFDQWFERQPSM